MSINATLFVQAIVFLLLVLFTMKFVWPPIAKALDERAQKIADGLAAADRAKTELAAANQRVEKELSESRNVTASRLADAERRAQAIIEEAKAAPRKKATRLLPPPGPKPNSNPSRPVRFCASRCPHWLSKALSRFCARKSMPASMQTC